MKPSDSDITQILSHIAEGDSQAWENLIQVVYRELHQLAFFQMKEERPDHTLQATALVNEVYMRLAQQKKIQWENRSHFFKAAAMAMNRILIDGARSRKAVKRGGGAKREDLDLIDPVQNNEDPFLDNLQLLDQALKRFEKDEFHRRKIQVVNLHFFSGLNFEEIGARLGVSTKTIKRDWAYAKAWLLREVQKIKEDG